MKAISGQALVAAAVIALGVVVAIETTSIAISPGYARIGPRLMPFVVAALLCGLGVVLMAQALTGRWGAEQPADHRPLPLLTIGAGLGAYALLMSPAGFVIASTVLFAAVARAFDSRRLLRDAGIGLALASVAFVFFTQVLQLPLPPGWILSLPKGGA